MTRWEEPKDLDYANNLIELCKQKLADFENIYHKEVELYGLDGCDKYDMLLVVKRLMRFRKTKAYMLKNNLSTITIGEYDIIYHDFEKWYRDRNISHYYDLIDRSWGEW